jgi:hypothetical protein
MDLNVLRPMLIIIFIIAVVVFLWIGGGESAIMHLLPSTHSTTTINSTNVQYNKTKSTTTITTVEPTSTIFQNCISYSQTTPIPNGNFANGTFENWNVSGLGFGMSPVNITSLNNQGSYYEGPWNNLGGTYFATTYEGGLTIRTGNITSEEFQVVQPYINFKIISPYNQNIYVEIVDAETNKPDIVVHYNTYINGAITPATTFANASIPVSTLMCRNVKIKVITYIVGSEATRLDYVAVGGFMMSKTPVQTPGIVVNENITS